jgi:hypothetical protein
MIYQLSARIPQMNCQFDDALGWVEPDQEPLDLAA